MVAVSTACAVVVAHPDDETLFFGGVIAQHPEIEWHVVCVTDGRDGGDPTIRSRELRDACSRLGVAHISELGFADSVRRPLPLDAIVPRLAAVLAEPIVLTHSALDVHAHHRQVLLACCLAVGIDRVSMFAPTVRLHPAALEAKRALLRMAYPSQFYAEELLRRYPWWSEGVEHPGFVIFDGQPFEPALLPEAVWSIALEADIVTRPERVLGRVEVARLPLSAGEPTAAQHSCSVIDRLVHHRAEEVMRRGKAHQLAWLSALRSIANHLDVERRLLTVTIGSREASVWILDGKNAYKPPDLTLRDASVASMHRLTAVANVANAHGAEILWFPPDDKDLETLESMEPGLVRFEVPRARPRPSAATLWRPI